MTDINNKDAIPRKPVTRYNVELVFKGANSAPVHAPNAAVASGVSGVIYLDLGFVDPSELSAIRTKTVTAPQLPKVNAQAMMRLAISSEIAKQIIEALSKQVAAMEDSKS